MQLDPVTLRTVGIVVHLLLGGLLLFSWRNSRANRELLFLGICFAGAALFDLLAGYAVGIGVPHFVDVGFAMLFFGYGAAWQAARLFERLPTSILQASAGGIGWLAFSLVASGDLLVMGRTVATTAVPVLYGALAIFELSRGRREYMPSRMPLCVALAGKSAIFVMRGLVLLAGALHTGNPVAAALPDDWAAPMRLVSLGANIAIAYLTLSLTKERLEAEQAVQILVDPLTGLGNRRALGKYAERIVRRHAISSAPLCVAIIDLDYFKQINDTYGHAVGDDVLRAFAERASMKLRPTDSLFRTGGEEFLCILQSAREKDAVQVMERIGRSMSGYRLGDGKAARDITVSVGVASSQLVGYDLEELTRAADNALYAAKRAGRNRVHVYTETTEQERFEAS
ncbi:diguanylate cyclase (GGDEF)-like protein [Pseudochelatococcus lubricantis]|uniref:diguanylate cyclase n=1 Tax=Pseudochelatococcus lubricantis TaxID=1538102 RepID=A0ABX0V314_9HYPH|nr:GGDEF domain-containing protein [Pseudochelatococcus lubricantis]NIJ59614.1 diguanylate cyclase (GGDEF)-like protein [Pseudochelatococcus lubricantis]